MKPKVCEKKCLVLQSFAEGDAEHSGVLRGGSWNNETQAVRSANRNRNTPDNRNNNIGFRLASPPACRQGMPLIVTRVLATHGWQKCVSGCPWHYLQARLDDEAE